MPRILTSPGHPNGRGSVFAHMTAPRRDNRGKGGRALESRCQRLISPRGTNDLCRCTRWRPTLNHLRWTRWLSLEHERDPRRQHDRDEQVGRPRVVHRELPPTEGQMRDPVVSPTHDRDMSIACASACELQRPLTFHDQRVGGLRPIGATGLEYLRDPGVEDLPFEPVESRCRRRFGLGAQGEVGGVGHRAQATGVALRS
jgi:hypothetical protein